MNKKISLGATLAFALIVAAAVFSVTMIFSQNQYNKTMRSLQEREQMYKKISEIDRQVRQHYYDAAAIDEDSLQNNLAKGYLMGIDDPYASYYSPEEYAEIERDREFARENVGIGVALSVNPDGYLLIEEVYPDSPAEINFLEAGNLIVRVGDTDVTSENSEEMLGKIYGPEGSELSLGVRRGGQDSTVELTRRSVAIPTVYTQYLSGGIGYVRITEFTDHTSNQFNREYKKLEDQGINAVIFDLRDNQSETLASATRILDRIVPQGTIVSVVDKDGNIKDVEVSDTSEMTLPIVTIVNGKTSSAGELFAQVLKDFDKTRIVGNLTAGRGIIQELIKLTDGSAIEVTTAMYLSRGEYTYHEIGVKPDYEVALPTGVTSWTVLEAEQDPQLQKAVELLSATLRSEGLFKEIETADTPPVVVEEPVSQGESQEQEDTSKDESSEESSEEDESSEEESSSGEESSSSEEEENAADKPDERITE